MSYDIHMYNSLNEGDPKKTYQTLRDIIRRHIERQTEDKMLPEKEKAVKNAANISKAAPKAKATPAPNDPKKPKPKSSGAMGETEEETPVIPTPDPKKKGKGKGSGKDRGRSTSVDKKKIRCKFFMYPRERMSTQSQEAKDSIKKYITQR